MSERSLPNGQDTNSLSHSDHPEPSERAHGVATITIRSPSTSAPSERERACPWSIQVDPPESLSSSVTDARDDHEPSSSSEIQNSERDNDAAPHTDSGRESLPRGPDDHARPFLRSLLGTLFDRLRESFSSYTPRDDPPVQPENLPDHAAPPRGHEVEQDRTEDASRRDEPAAQGLSIRLLDPASDALRRFQETGAQDASVDTTSPEASQGTSSVTRDAAGESLASQPTTESSAAGGTDASTSASADTAAPHESSSNGPNLTPNPGTENGPQFLMYIPRTVSPFPFAFLYDTEASLAWPILDQEASNPESDGPPRTVHVVGFPFRVSFSFRTEPEEQADPERAAEYVRHLEHVDAELRKRMSRFGIGDLGMDVFGESEGTVTGCGVCLEPYAIEDRPTWFVGEEQSEKEAVVVVPCRGFHTLHACCLHDWLANTPPSKWVCPFCRHSLRENEPCPTLLEHVREKEREAGWRCDAPACLPRDLEHDGPCDARAPPAFGTQLVTMHPCRHEVHMDCLCTAMSVEYSAAFEPTDAEASDEDDTDASDTAGTDAEPLSQSRQLPPVECADQPVKLDTVGKWVVCPSCRKDAWAQVPTCRRPSRGLPPASQ